MARKLPLAFFISVFFCALAHAEQPYPFIGEITAENVNIRAGQDVSFERLGKLSKGAEVVVVKKNFSWYQIKLPDTGECYIHKKFVSVAVSGYGTVAAQNVNLRGGPGEKFSVVGKVDKDTVVKIIGESQDWYKLEPMEGVYGWVAEQFIKFKSNEVPAPKVITIPSRNIYRKAAAEQSGPEVAGPKEPELFSAQGRVEDLGRFLPFRNIRYKLICDDKKIYYLEGTKELIDSFVYYTVKVEGNLVTEEKKSNYPIIVVIKIHLTR